MIHNSSQKQPSARKPKRKPAAKPVVRKPARRLRRRGAMTKEQVERWAEAKAEALMRVMRRLRIGFGRSQENVAEGCGLTRQGLSFMERSKRWPLLVNVLRACASLRISLRQLAMVARC